MSDNTRKPTQRYLSGRVKLTDIDNLSSDRHLYLHPGEVEPNLGKPGERTLPVSDTYYRLVTIPNGILMIGTGKKLLQQSCWMVLVYLMKVIL